MMIMMISILIETSGPSLGSSVLKVPLVDSGKETPFSQNDFFPFNFGLFLALSFNYAFQAFFF